MESAGESIRIAVEFVGDEEDFEVEDDVVLELVGGEGGDGPLLFVEEFVMIGPRDVDVELLDIVLEVTLDD